MKRCNVANDASPALTSSKTFTVTVNLVAGGGTAPEIGAASIVNGQFNLQVMGVSSGNVSIQTSSNLVDWTTIFTTNSPPQPFNWTDTQPTQQPALFYRVVVGP